jgi:hypothetical protein
LAKKFQLDVGNSEKHHLEISAEPFPPIIIFVHGKEAKNPETASPPRKASKLNSFFPTQYRDKVAIL